jgi:hypothetical protein
MTAWISTGDLFSSAQMHVVSYFANKSQSAGFCNQRFFAPEIADRDTSHDASYIDIFCTGRMLAQSAPHSFQHNHARLVIIPIAKSVCRKGLFNNTYVLQTKPCSRSVMAK